jgi:N-acetylglucosaminyl-diphospho-decaprenol L-rhamnosyltransferase
MYKTPAVLEECLRSFERHRPRRVGEVIVIDNSVDVEGASPQDVFPWIDYELNAENVHFRGGVNQGVRRARLPYVLILNPDTYLTDSDAIATLAETLDADPSVGFVAPKLRGDDGKLAPQGERIAGLAYLFALKGYLNAVWPANPLARRHARAGLSRERSGPADTVSAAALLCRRDEFLAVGGFDERARMYWEEHELARKLRRLGLHGYYRADAFLFHHWRKGGTEHATSTDAQRYFEEAMRLYYRTFYGRLGSLLYGSLDRVQRLVRAARRAELGTARRRRSGRPRG